MRDAKNAGRDAQGSIIRVAVVVIRSDNRLWVRKRKETGHLDGYWEFPGGKVRDTEEPREAAIRELHEETGLQVEPSQLRLLSRIDFTYPECRLDLSFFLLDLQARASLPSKRACWMTASELLIGKVPPANYEVLKLLSQDLSNKDTTRTNTRRIKRIDR